MWRLHRPPTMRNVDRLGTALLVSTALALAGPSSGCASLSVHRGPTRCESLCVRHFDAASVAIPSGPRSCVCYAPFQAGEFAFRPTMATIELLEAPRPQNPRYASSQVGR